MRRSLALLLTLIVVGALTSACSSNDDPAASSASSSSAVCASRDQLKASVDALEGVDLRAGGTSALQPAIDQVDRSAKTFETAAQGAFTDVSTRVKTSMNALRSAFSAVNSGDVTVSIATVQSDIAVVATTTAAFVTKVTSAC